jgi:hypothetical protein
MLGTGLGCFSNFETAEGGYLRQGGQRIKSVFWEVVDWGAWILGSCVYLTSQV